MIGYFAWLVDSGECKAVEAHCIPVGHTKFTPDASFGLLKKMFGRAEICLPFHLKEMANKLKNVKALLKDGQVFETSFL